MSIWFHIEEVSPHTYAISEPDHWEEPNCYLLLGKECAVLIDTGLGVSNIRKAVEQITSLPILVITTHVHWDHIGGHKQFENFAVHELEEEWISGQFPLPLDAVKRNLTYRPCTFPESFDLVHYQIYQGKPTLLLRDGDVIDFGERRLLVIHTPGHSPGHCCFYEPERKFLYSGDLIYRGCLDAFYPTTNPIQFYQSVKKVSQLDIQRILPGHHALDVPVDMIERIAAAFKTLEQSGRLYHGNGFLILEISKYTFRRTSGGENPARSFLSIQADAQFFQILDHLAVVLILVL